MASKRTLAAYFFVPDDCLSQISSDTILVNGGQEEGEHLDLHAENFSFL